MQSLEHLKMNISYCAQCTKVVYCSESCRKRAWSNHHYVECKHYELLYHSDLTSWNRLALRVVLKTGLKQILGLKSYLVDFELQYPTEKFKIDQAKRFDSGDYLNIFHLVTHSHDRDPAQLLWYATVASILHWIMLESDFYSGFECNSDDKALVGGLLMRHLQSNSFNSYEISGSRPNERLLKWKTCSIGIGIYGAMSFANHSCDASATRDFHGVDCILRALKRIPANEQVTISYTFSFSVHKLEERQSKLLEHHFFICNCKACEQKWPLCDEIPDKTKHFRLFCEACGHTVSSRVLRASSSCCSKEDHLKALKNLETKFKILRGVSSLTFPRFLKEKNLDDANTVISYLNDYLRYLNFMDDHIPDRPFRDYCIFQEGLKHCFYLLSQNKSVAIEPCLDP
jgi:hypothetical protein